MIECKKSLQFEVLNTTTMEPTSDVETTGSDVDIMEEQEKNNYYWNKYGKKYTNVACVSNSHGSLSTRIVPCVSNSHGSLSTKIVPCVSNSHGSLSTKIVPCVSNSHGSLNKKKKTNCY